MRISRWICAGMCAASVAAFGAGCGSSSDSDTSSSSSGATAAAGTTAAAESTFTPITGLQTEPPTEIFNTTPVTKPIPSGKTVAYVIAGAPLYSYVLKNFQLAAAKVGWTVKPIVYKTDAGPAIQTAIQAKVDAIFGISLVEGALKQQLADAKKAGIPVFNQGTPVDSDPDQLYFTTAHNNISNVKMGMDWIINDSEGKANIAVFNLPEIPFFENSIKAEKEEIAAKCPDCKIEIVDQTLADFGAGKLGANTAAYLQSNPDVDYVAYQFGDMMANVVPPLQTAGLLDKVKLVCLDAATQPVVQGIVDGTIAAGITTPTAAQGWWQVDYMGRYFNGDPIEPAAALKTGGEGPEYPAQPWIIETPEVAKTLADKPYGWAGPEGYEEQFQKLWDVG